MAKITRSAFKAAKNTRYATNGIGAITGTVTRAHEEDTADSVVFIDDDISTNADFTVDGTKLTDRASIKTFVEANSSQAAGAANEIQINDGSNALAGGKVFIPTNGNVTLGDSGLSGTSRTIEVSGSPSNISINLTPKGTGVVTISTGLTLTGASTIQTSTGALTIATGAGNGNIILSPHGTGNVGIGTATPSNTLDVDGTARIRTISNATGNFLTTSATGVVQQRTPAQTLTDIGAQPSGSYLTSVSFLDLTDTPSSYTTHGEKLVRVNAGATGLEFFTAPYLTSVPVMTATVDGIAKLFSNTVQPIAAAAVSETASRTYGLQLNSSGQLVVNVPWVNTTYTAGNGISLSGTTFSVAAGDGLTQQASGLAVDGTVVRTSGSYANPAWITSLAWSKITGTPTTVSGYGITDAVSGTGTTNYIPKFTGSTSLGNSQIFDNGTNVGIGTIDPNQKLTVIGNVRAGGVGNGFLLDTDGVEFTNGLKVVNSFETVMFSGRGSAGYVIAGNNNIRFGFGVDYSAGERMRITSGGAVLINRTTTLGSGMLHVSGDARFTGDLVAFSTSDKKYKDNLKPIENAIAKIKALTGYTFDWNDKQSTYTGRDIGVVAQEVRAVLPEIINVREGGDLAVKYDKIVALLIEGMKEQQKEIEYLKTKLVA